MQAYKALFHHKKGFIHVPAIFFSKFIDKCCYIYSIRNSFWKKFVFLHDTQYIKIIQIIKMKKSQLIFYIWISIFLFAYSKSDNNQLLTKNKWTFLSYDIQVKPNLLFKSKTYCWSNTCRASIVIYLDSFMKLIKFSATLLEKFKEIY